MAAIMDLSFPGQRTTTATSCIPHDSVYMPGPRAEKSENGVLGRATEKSTKTKISPRMEERISVVKLWWGKGENVLHCLQESKEKKSICKWWMLPPVCTGDSKHVEEDKGPFILIGIVNIRNASFWHSHMLLFVRVRVGVCRHYNSVIVWETCNGIWNKTVFFIVILDSKYSKMTPKFVQQKSHWLHSLTKFANPGTLTTTILESTRTDSYQ